MSKTKERIRESNLRYKHELGQHFLFDEDLLNVLVDDAGVTKDIDVLEIGPGAGTLTKPLCEKAGRVVSLELDERLIPLLEAYMSPYDNFTLKQGDVMFTDLQEITKDLRKPFAVVANIPYYITTPLIQRLLTCGIEIDRIAVMIQKEVADKILAQPGDEAWGPLSVRCQYACECEMTRIVPRACFTPPPKVDSAFVVMKKRETPPVTVKSEKDFFRAVNAGFSLRRKTLVNALNAGLHYRKEQGEQIVAGAGLDLKVRAERLTMEEWARVADLVTETEAER